MYVRRVLLITRLQASIPVYGVFDCRDNFILRAADTMCLKLPHSIPDDDAVLAMQAALRDFKAISRKPKPHPRREDILALLTDARAAIERING